MSSDQGLFANLRALLKSHFFAGLLVVIPLGVISWIVLAALSSLWRLHEILPDAWQPENVLPNAALASLVNAAFMLGATLLLALGLSALGWASKQYLGRKALDVVAHVIQRIPVLRSVYSALDQLLRAIAAGGGQQFSRVVYVEYPRKGSWTLAFVTGPARLPAPGPGQAVGERMLSIYVPTTPNPTSGFYLIVPEADVRESHLRVEDAFKTLLSLGIAQSSPAEPHGGEP